MTDPYRVRRVLVPVDGSELSRFAAEYAVRMAAAQGSDVVFLHVVDREVITALTHRGTVSEIAARQQLMDNGAVYLQDAARFADEGGVAHQEQVHEGDPAAAILDAAARIRADIIVMGRLGRHGARRMLMGSITQRVIECSDRPVLVINGPIAETP